MMIKNIKINKKILAALLLSSSLGLSGCKGFKTVADCDINVRHAHLYSHLQYSSNYKSPNIYEYVESEKLSFAIFDRNEEYIEIDDEEALKLQAVANYNFSNRFTNYFIVKIDDNKEYIDYIKDYASDNYINSVDYKCYGEVFNPKGTDLTDPLNRLTNTWDYETYYSKDPNNKDATGEKRLKYYSFYGYNLVKNDKGYELVKSDDYYSIDDLVANCEYIGHYYVNDKEKTEDQELIEYILKKNPNVKSR